MSYLFFLLVNLLGGDRGLVFRAHGDLILKILVGCVTGKMRSQQRFVLLVCAMSLVTFEIFVVQIGG